MKPSVHNGRSGQSLAPAVVVAAVATLLPSVAVTAVAQAVAAPAERVIRVSSIAALQSAAAQAQPGDRIELAAGSYSASRPIRLTRSGTASAPITVAAERVGATEIRGSAGFTFGAVSHVTVAGFRLTHAGEVSVPTEADHIRLTRNVFQISSGSTRNWVTVSADDSEVDHNTFQHKRTVGVFLQIAGVDGDVADRVRIHHNYFFDHAFGGANGGESIRLGHSHRQHASARAVIEENLFERADGDSEAISVKASDNTVRFNTLRNSRGGIVLRHGHRTLVDGNVVLGGRSGIRFYGNDHVIVNNVVQGSAGTPIEVGGGDIIDDTRGSTQHERADRVLVAFNTVVGRGELLKVGSSKRYGPDSCVFANNVLVGSGSGGLVGVNQGSKLRWQGNIVWAGSGGDMPSSGYRAVNPGLVQDAAGLSRLRTGSAAIDAALGSYPQAVRDLDDQVRTEAKDVGADEFVPDAPTRRPLTTADVGPAAP